MTPRLHINCLFYGTKTPDFDVFVLCNRLVIMAGFRKMFHHQLQCYGRQFVRRNSFYNLTFLLLKPACETKMVTITFKY